MKKVLIFTISLILVISLVTGCDNSRSEAPEEVDEIEVVGGIKIHYAIEDEEDIFGNLQKEEIIEIIDEIFEKVSNDENFKDNVDSIIEKVFKQHGITDEDNLDAAKSKLKISKTE